MSIKKTYINGILLNGTRNMTPEECSAVMADGDRIIYAGPQHVAEQRALLRAHHGLCSLA